MVSLFLDKYGSPDLIVSAPGRVNIIGEHIDYNGGTVMPFAIEKKITLIFKKSCNSYSSIYSDSYKEEFILEHTIHNSDHWSRFFQKVLEVLKNHAFSIDHFELLFGGDIPVGAGLSSSSAISCGFIAGLNALFNLNLTKDQIIQFASIAENNTGVLGGIMDQTAIVKSLEGNALILSCDDNSFHYVNGLIPEHEWLIINSKVEHNLVSTDYNVRNLESKEALEIIRNGYPEVSKYLDINQAHLSYLQTKNPTLYNRALHFYNEQKRVVKMIDALSKQDVKTVGQILNDSHRSLDQLYEVSCEEINFLIHALKSIKAIKGARMIGGGFGGAILCLIDKSKQSEVIEKIEQPYAKLFNLALSSFIVNPSQGLKVSLCD